jgi:CARDB
MFNNSFRTFLSVICFGVLLVSNISCVYINVPKTPSNDGKAQVDQTTQPVTAIEPPVIESFTASSAAILPGNSVTLSWNVKNANAIQITPDIGKVAASDSHIVKPTTATNYTLFASNAGGMNSKAVTINILTATVSDTLIAKPVPNNQDLKDLQFQEIKGVKVLPSKPDLTIQYLEVCQSDIPFGLSVAHTQYILYVVGNLGKAPSTPCKLVLLIDGVVKDIVPIPAIQPDALIENSFKVILVRPEPNLFIPPHHTFEVNIDYDKTVDESDESNNFILVEWQLIDFQIKPK